MRRTVAVIAELHDTHSERRTLVLMGRAPRVAGVDRRGAREVRGEQAARALAPRQGENQRRTDDPISASTTIS
jgi:hypothetical protein